MKLWQMLSSPFRRTKPSIEAGVPVSGSPIAAQTLESIPEDVANFVLKRWDAGIFAQELVNTKLAPIAPTKDKPEWSLNDGQIEEGTYGGTQLALTEMYDRIERAYVLSIYLSVYLSPNLDTLQTKYRRFDDHY